MTATNVQKSTFSLITLALIVGALAVSTSSSTAAPSVSIGSGTTKPVGVTGGKTILKLNKRMTRKLKRAKVRVKPTGSATGGMRKLVFPITGGRIGIKDGKPVGKIRHKGSGLSFKETDASSAYIALRDSGEEPEPYSVWRFYFRPKIGDGVIAFFALSELEVLEFQDGQNAIGFRAKLKLTNKSAKLLGKRLGIGFRPGTTVASLISEMETSQSGDDEAEDS